MITASVMKGLMFSRGFWIFLNHVPLLFKETWTFSEPKFKLIILIQKEVRIVIKTKKVSCLMKSVKYN